MRDWFHSILEFLYKEHPFDGQDVPLNDFFINNLNIENHDLEKAKQLRTVLEHLQKSEFMGWKNDSVLGGSILGGDGITHTTPKKYTGTLEFNKVSVKLTLKGHKYFSEREWQNKLLDSQVKTNDSVNSTNDSARNLYDKVLPDNFKAQTKSNKWSRWLAGLSIMFIGITAALQWRDKTPTEVKDLKLQVQKSSQTLDSIRLSLKEINFSMKKMSDSVSIRLKK